MAPVLANCFARYRYKVASCDVLYTQHLGHRFLGEQFTNSKQVQNQGDMRPILFAFFLQHRCALHCSASPIWQIWNYMLHCTREQTNFLFDTDSSLQLYMTIYEIVHSVYQYSDFLSNVRCHPHRRLISRFRCDCHGLRIECGSRQGVVNALRIDTGRFAKGTESCSREKRSLVAHLKMSTIFCLTVLPTVTCAQTTANIFSILLPQ